MTSLTVLSKPSAYAVLGEAWTVRVRTVDEYGYVTGAVAPVAAAVLPDASALVPTFLSDTSLGDWTTSIVLTQAGRWTLHVSTPEDALDVAVWAEGPTTGTGMPTVDDVARYLGQSASSWDRGTLQDALDAERSDQRARCGERAQYPDALRQALLRRVARNLAMRRLPLAVNVGDADGGSLVLPGRDPEVRRLEAPYRRLVVG